MPKANVDKKYDIALNQSLNKCCFEKVEFSNALTNLVILQEIEKKIKSNADYYVLRDRVDKE